MKTIAIRLPDVEAGMIAEVQKKATKLRALDKLLIDIIRDEYFCLFKHESTSRLT